MYALQRPRHARLLRSNGGARKETASIHRRTRTNVPTKSRRGCRDALRRSRGRGHAETDHQLAETRRLAPPEEPGEGDRREHNNRGTEAVRFRFLPVRSDERSRDDRHSHAISHRRNTTPRTVQRHGNGDGILGHPQLAARLQRRARLQARLHHQVPREGCERLVDHTGHAFRKYSGYNKPSGPGDHLRVPRHREECLRRGYAKQTRHDQHYR